MSEAPRGAKAGKTEPCPHGMPDRKLPSFESTNSQPRPQWKWSKKRAVNVQPGHSHAGTTKDLFRELRGRDLYASDAPSILDAAATDDHAQQRGPFSEENRARYLFGKAVENESRVRPLRARKDSKRDKLTVDEAGSLGV